MNKTYHYAVVLNNKVIDVVAVNSSTEGQAQDTAFSHADHMVGADIGQDVELFDLACPRSWVLFAPELDFNGRRLFNPFTGRFYSSNLDLLGSN